MCLECTSCDWNRRTCKVWNKFEGKIWPCKHTFTYISRKMYCTYIMYYVYII